LIAVYDRSDAEIRFCCTEALGVIGGEKAVLTLRRALNDANPQIREMAKFRLAQLAERGH
jgi:HEAT repeat protein